MGIQNTIRDQNSSTSSIEGGLSAGAIEAVDYITDLLNELQTIANIQGLQNLSNDIHSVVRKHVIEPN